MLLTVNKLNDVLSGIIGNNKYSIGYNDAIYNSLTDLEGRFDVATTLEDAKSIIKEAEDVITNGVQEDVLKAYGEFLKFDEKAQKFYLYSNGVTSSVPLPKALADKMVEAMDKQMPTLPFIKAWMWFLKNPKFNPRKANLFAKYITTTYVDKKQLKELIEQGYSVEKATELATYNDLSITKNGLLSTYKYAAIRYKRFNAQTGESEDRYNVTYDEATGEATVNLPENAEDYSLIPPMMGDRGDAFYADNDLGHSIAVGKVHFLDSWDKVNCTDGQACLPGLHLGGQRYIEGYGGNGNLLLNCFVNPMNIGAFTDTGDGAIRVKEYFVHSAQFAPNKSFYNESAYLERSNEQWKEIFAEAVKSSEERIQKIKAGVSELAAL